LAEHAVTFWLILRFYQCPPRLCDDLFPLEYQEENLINCFGMTIA